MMIKNGRGETLCTRAAVRSQAETVLSRILKGKAIIHEVYLMTFTRGGLGGKICQNQSAYTVEESVQVGQNNTGIPSLFH